MMDISARELKGHNILAVERFWDNTRWMIEFSVLRPSTAYGSPGEEMRLFLTEDGYQAALQSQQRREIKIKRYDELEQAHNTTYGEFKTVRDDLHRLWKVKSCVDTAARFNERTEEQMLQNRPQTRHKKEDMTR